MNTPKTRRSIAAPVLLATLCLPAPLVPAATGNPWFDDFENYYASKGDAYKDSPDAAVLAWQESLMLRSMLNLYDATKNPLWLDRFVDHMSYVLAKAVDTDGDGYRDWTTARYSPDHVRIPNVLTTGGFEVGASGDATLPLGWTRSGATSTTAFRTNTAGEFYGPGTCPTSAWGLELVTDGSTTQRLSHVLAGPYEPNHTYQLSIYGKRGGTVNGRASVVDVTTGTTLASIDATSTSWKNYRLDFTTPVAGHTLELRLEHAATGPTGQSVFFDTVRVSGHFSYHVLDGMIGIPMANFVRLVKQNPSAFSTTIQTAANDYQDFLEDHVIARWQDASAYYGNTWVSVSASEGYYREPDPTVHDTFSTGESLDPLPYNQYFALIEVQNILYDVNANAAYLDKAEDGATYFANRLTTVTVGTPPNATQVYDWYYAAFPGAKVEDASHANVDMEFISEMHRSGSVFTNADMLKFTGTLLEKLWNGSLTSPEQNNHVNGGQGDYCVNHLFSSIMYGWIPYAQFDPLAWTIAARQYAPVSVNDHSSALTLSQILRWDPVKLVNQGFELADAVDATLPARWSRFLSTSTTAYRDAANKASGDYGLTLVSNGSSWQKLVQPWPEYVASVSYTVTFDGKADGSGANGRVWIYNETTATTIASYNFTNTSWQTHAFTFTSPANTADVVKIQLGHLNYTVTNGKAHYDNVSIRPTSETW